MPAYLSQIKIAVLLQPAIISSLASDLELQMAEQFPNKRKIPPEIGMNLDQGLMFLFIYWEITQPFAAQNLK